ncbi:hypothetical protein BJX99DRAFT_253963 [Aspergillus californicus]
MPSPPSAYVFCAWIFWGALMINGAQAQGWDDFSNNLATDLSPLIALFGEQATKQFLSESLSPLDNFIFAMAPIGILTAVVSAIRVCGSSSLRAFIGRAQEGGGTVEAELCSSTGRSVSELYNNVGITRVFGRPKILEVVRVNDPDPSDFYDKSEPEPDHGTGTAERRKCTAGVFTFKGYQNTSTGLTEWQEVNDGIRNLFGLQSDKWLPWNFEYPVRSYRHIPAQNPNLSLNIGIKRQPHWVFCAAALIGFFVQTGVLVFGAIVTYRLRWEKDGRTPDPWGFPLALSGTILQCTGMFLCAWLVDQSTKEWIFRKKTRSSDPQKGTLSSMHWLQPGNQAVGDQIFDAFAYNDSDKPLRDYVFSQKDDNLEPVYLVWLAISVTMGGFLLQFVGLRAIHSSVAVFQLGAMLLMSIVRAGLRARRFDKHENQLHGIIEDVEGHELDWQALHFEANKADSWMVVSGPNEEKSGSMCEDGVVFIKNTDASQGRTVIGFAASVKWEERIKIISAAQKDRWRSTQEQSIQEQSLGQQPESELPRPSLPVRILKYRARLARMTTPGPQVSSLAAWEDKHVHVRSCAQSLKMVIEGTADILFSSNHIKECWKDKSFIVWALDIATEPSSNGQNKTDTVFISTWKENNSNSWKVDISELEAMLGLWTWSSLRRFRQSHVAKRFYAERVVAGFTEAGGSVTVMVDLRLWMDDMKKSPRPDVVRRNQYTRRSFGLQYTRPSFGLKAVQAGEQYFITIPADERPVNACAQDIFMHFLSVAGCMIDEIGGKTTPKLGSRGFFLANDTLSKLLQLFHTAGIGSKEDAYWCIIPVLRAKSLLPSVNDSLDDIRLIATNARKDGKWKYAENLLQWICRQSKTADDKQKSVLALAELYRWAMLDGPIDRRLLDATGWIEHMEKRVGDYPTIAETISRYKKVFETILDKDLLQISTIQHAAKLNFRVDALVLLRRGVTTTDVDEAGRTTLHWAAIRGWVEVVIGLLELGAEPDFGDQIHRTALSYASENGHVEILYVLIKAGASPASTDKARRTPLSYAAAEGHQSVVESLLKDVRVACDTTDNLGQTPLHWAAKGDYVPVVKKLLQANTSNRGFIDAQDHNGWTALMAALCQRGTNVAALLAREGANCASRIPRDGGGSWLSWEMFFDRHDLESARFLLTRLPEVEFKKSLIGQARLRGEGLSLMLECRPEVKITEDVLKAIAQLEQSPEIIKLLLVRRPEIRLSQGIVDAARGNPISRIQIRSLLKEQTRLEDETRTAA